MLQMVALQKGCIPELLHSKVPRYILVFSCNLGKVRKQCYSDSKKP